MKFNYYRMIIMLLMMQTITAGCSKFLDKPASDDMTVDVAYENILSAQKVLNNLYWETQQGAYNVVSRNIPYATADDDAVAGYSIWGNYFHEGSWTPEDDQNAGDQGTGSGENTPPTCLFWKHTYERVRKTNLFLASIGGVNGDESLKNMYKAEARFLRAFFYAELVKRFGGVILRTEVTDDYKALLEDKRATFEECVNWIVNELDESAAVLPQTRPNAELGRATKGACYAVKSRLLLFAASPLFNTNDPVLPSYTPVQYYGNYDIERWKKAADACKQVMDLGYSIYIGNFAADTASVQNYYQRYRHIFFTVSNETIWLSNPVLNWGGAPVFWYNRSANGANWVNPTLELAEQFEMLNGKLPNEAGSGYDFQNPGISRDPRFKANIQYPGSSYPQYAFEPWIGGAASHLESQKTGMCMQKYLDEDFNPGKQGLTVTPNCVQLFRYTEILLNYAEAMNEYSGPSAEVYGAVNAVRARVGMPALPAGLTQPAMREKIVHERRVELAFEDFRFFDVRRWRIAEETQDGYVHGYDVSKGKTTGFWNIVTVGNPHVFVKKHYLYPLSTQEILLNKNLVQNPGW